MGKRICVGYANGLTLFTVPFSGADEVNTIMIYLLLLGEYWQMKEALGITSP